MPSLYFWIIPVLGSWITMFCVTIGIFSILKKFHLVDKPHLYPHEQGREPLPYPGGIVLVLNILLWSPWIFTVIDPTDIKKTIYVIVAWMFTTFFMAWDDQRRSIHPFVRLGFQVLLGTFFWLTAIKIGYVSNIFGGIITLDQFELLQWHIGENVLYLIPLLVTIIWYVLVMNAINWSDNGRAMTSSVSLVTCIILAWLAIKLYFTDTTFAAQNNSLFVLAFLSILIPTIFIFRLFDVRRKCIVGDAWTMFLGFMIATLAIVAGGKIATASIVLGIYFIDAFYVILMRIRMGKNPLRGDLTHLHHRMAEQGIDFVLQRRIVMIGSFVFGLWAIFLSTWGKIILFVNMIVFVFFIEKISKILLSLSK